MLVSPCPGQRTTGPATRRLTLAERSTSDRSVHCAMMRRRIGATHGARLGPALAAVRAREGVAETFPPEVLAAADRAARAPRLPDLDLTAIPFVTLDPPAS